MPRLDYGKPCTKCGQHKPLTDYFVKREHGKERLASHCKTCHREIMRDWEGRNRDRVRATNRLSDAGMSGVRRRQRLKEWQADNAVKIAAHGAVARATSKGELVRPIACDVCQTQPGKGFDGRPLVEAHHEDYTQPLVVSWLCSSCHKFQHSRT